MSIQHIRKALVERLYQRQLQAAKQGINADPAVFIEQKHLTTAIAAIDRCIYSPSYPELEQDVRRTCREVGVIVTTINYWEE